MKILFTRFPLESRYGGAEVQTITLMRGLVARGHAVAFWGSCPTLLRLCREEGIPAAALPIGPPPVTKWGAVSFLWRKNAMRRHLIETFDQIRPDIVCMLSLSEKILLTEHARTKGSHVFWIEHDRVGRWLTKNPWLARSVCTSTYGTTICVSELSRKMYVELGWDPNRTIAIPNGIDTARFQSQVMSPEKNLQDSRLKTQDSYLRLGTLARLTHDKGIDLLIEAVADVPNVHLSIIGQGREEEALRALIQAKKAQDRITITPHIDDLGGFYRSLDLFVLPSREHDPFGLSAAEAMLCGIATVVTDVCGIAGYLQSGTDALVVRAGDPGALRKAVLKLSDPQIRSRIAASGRTTAEAIFSAETMVDAYDKVFAAHCSTSGVHALH